MIRIAIVEDEQQYRELLQHYLRRYEMEHDLEFHIDYFTDGDEIVEQYRQGYDLILMDIMMEFLDGMSAAEQIRAQDELVTLIFITNMQNYAIRGYQVGAFDYILKPISYFALEKSLSRALSRMELHREQAFTNLTTPNGIHRIPLKEIIYIDSDAHYLTFHTQRGEIRTYMRMRDAEKELPAKHFFRINKGIIVNLRYVDGVENGCCLTGGQQLPVSRAKQKAFMEVLTRFFMSR